MVVQISRIFLKRITTSIIKPLTIVINQVLNNGIFPDKLNINFFLIANMVFDRTVPLSKPLSN